MVTKEQKEQIIAEYGRTAGDTQQEIAFSNIKKPKIPKKPIPCNMNFYMAHFIYVCYNIKDCGRG